MNNPKSRLKKAIHLTIALAVLLIAPIAAVLLTNRQDQPFGPDSTAQTLTEIENAADLRQTEEILENTQLDAPDTSSLDRAVEELL